MISTYNGRMKWISRCFIAALVLSTLGLPVYAGVQISVAGDLDPDHYIMIKTDLVNSGLRGSQHDTIGISFLQSGQTENLTVLGTLPRLFNKVTALALHPAYYLASASAKTAPPLLRKVILPPLKPQSWKQLLTTAEPLREGMVGITAATVNDHFRLILREYLPAFDRAAIPEDLRQHLPRLRELATFAQTPQASQNSLQNRRVTPGDKNRNVTSVKNIAGQELIQLQRRLQEIEAWLAVDQQRRRPMHDWIENYHKPSYVLRQIMQKSDRQKVFQMLRQSQTSSYFSQHSWINKETGVKFSFSLENKTGNSSNPGYRSRLITDLNPRLGLQGNTAYLRKCFPNFVKIEKIGWQLK